MAPRSGGREPPDVDEPAQPVARRFVARAVEVPPQVEALVDPRRHQVGAAREDVFRVVFVVADAERRRRPVADVRVGEAEHVDGGEARVVGDLARGVDGDGLAAMLGPAEEAAELDPAVVLRARVAEPPVGGEGQELEGQRDDEARRGQDAAALRRPAREDRGSQRHEDEQEALAEDVAPHVDPVAEPARGEERLEGQPSRARRRHRGRGQHDEVRQQAGAEGEIGELPRGIGDAARRAGRRPSRSRCWAAGGRNTRGASPRGPPWRAPPRGRPRVRAPRRGAGPGTTRRSPRRRSRPRARGPAAPAPRRAAGRARAVVARDLRPECDLQQQHQRRLHPRRRSTARARARPRTGWRPAPPGRRRRGRAGGDGTARARPRRRRRSGPRRGDGSRSRGRSGTRGRGAGRTGGSSNPRPARRG